MKFETQLYKGIPLKLINRKYAMYKAKRYTLNGTNQNVWIPNKHLYPDGTIRPEQDLDYIFRQAWRQCQIAGCRLKEES